jgi:tetratricopeptide (TPR) repeat protein
MRRRSLLFLFLLLIARSASAQMQIPEKFENLKVLPKDMPREQLIATMRGFALGLGVRCEYCHAEQEGAAAGPGGPQLDFKADKKTTKEKARFMLRMVSSINDSILPKLKDRADPAVRVNCVTCHRGSPLPKTLDVLLVETINKSGVDSAVASYRKLREQALTSGRYNFSEVTLSEVARTLLAAQKPDDALRILQLNQEFFPQSGNTTMQIADVYRAKGDKEKAIEYYKKTLELQPNNGQAKRRLQELGVS